MIVEPRKLRRVTQNNVNYKPYLSHSLLRVFFIYLRAPIHFKPCTRKNSILCTEPYVGLHAKTAQKRHEGHFLFISQLVSNVNSIFVLSFLKKLGSSTSSVRPYPHAMLVLHKCSHLLISEVTIFCLSKPLYDPLDLRRQRVPLRL